MENGDNGQELEYKDTTFFGLAKIVNINMFLNWSFAWSLIFLILIIYVISDDFHNNLIKLSKSLPEYLLTTSGGVFGIVVAALSITIALFHKELLPAMLKTKLLHKYLFPFWKASVLWAFNILINFSLIFFDILDLICTTKWLILFVIFNFLYAVFYTVRLSGVVIELALQRARIVN